MPPMITRARITLIGALLSALLGLGLLSAPGAAADNPVTPGNITGYGFDQCLTPNQKSMNRWMQHSPFLAVGIYISGDSRACRDQPNLNATWVRKQLKKGWRLLPITLGPQASCQPRFPRYDDDFKISTTRNSKGKYRVARKMGVNEAVKAVAAAQRLGIVKRSTLYYDLEGFDLGNGPCRESALEFVSGWTKKVNALGYVSGVYSSASSGIKMLDDARVQRPGQFNLPQQIWLARWDGVANTSSSYLRSDGWRPGGRLKQYRGGHDEVHGGVRINIDSNYLDLGTGSRAPKERRCGGVNLSFDRYRGLRAGQSTPQVRALQCALKEKGYYKFRITGRFNNQTATGVKRWKADRRRTVDARWRAKDWGALWAMGKKPVRKVGSSGYVTLRVQRAINSLYPRASVKVTGVYNTATRDSVRRYQAKVGVRQTGIVNGVTWRKLAAGVRS